ncbi:MAG: protein BatD [Gammaproteobacteria bacterium]|nr:protein BatD [Gammaproteobacteria bacterium]
MVKKLVATAFLVASIPIFAEVTVSLSQTEISEIERVSLTIRLEGIPPRDDPDFSALEDDFDILSQMSETDQRLVNNQYTSSKTWTLVLKPKKVAELKIPSFAIGNFTSEELSIKVVPISEELAEKLDQEVFWVTTVDRKEQYVHGGIHVERKLYYSNNVSLVRIGRRGGLPAPQDVEDAHIVNLGNQNDDWAPRNGRSYRVYTQEFVIFAEKSGTLSLPQTSVTANIDLDNRSVAAVVRTEPHDLTILPRPEEYPSGIPWLPASNVVITDDLGELDLSDLVVGDSFSRRITIEALDSISTGIPEIEVELPQGMRSYPTTPNFNNERLGNKIIGTRSDEQAFVVTQAGEFTIPDTELVWWNTNTKQVERSIIPGRTFVVGAGSAANASGNSNNSGRSNSRQIQGASGLEGSDGIFQRSPFWVIVLASTAIALWVVSIGVVGVRAWILNRRRKRDITTSDEDVKVETLLKSNSSRDVKEGMLRWLTLKLEVSRVGAILLLQKHPTTATALRGVNDHQYGTTSKATKLDRNEIKRALREIEREVQQQRAHTTTFWQFYQPT